MLFIDGFSKSINEVLDGVKDNKNRIFERFLVDNVELVGEIKKLLLIRDKILILTNLYIDLLRKHKLEEAEKFNSENNLWLFIFLLWSKLNPLLDEAAEKLKELWFTEKELRM